jgi:hypothetical protein
MSVVSDTADAVSAMPYNRCFAFIFEYIQEFETEFENNWRVLLRGRFMKKNQRPKISCYL